MLLSKTIPNLYNGVSQQPPQLRHPTQCESLDNGYPAIATGLRKRPPLEHVGKLSATSALDAAVHTINRSATERYTVIIRNGSIAVHDINDPTTAHTVSTPDGVTYITTSDPAGDLVVLTVSDYTFILNKTVATASLGTTTSGSLTGTVQQFSNLPGSPSTGDIYRVEGSADSSFDDYYVKWNGTVWVETTAPGEAYKLDPATMPYILTKTGATSWTFEQATWTDRQVGNLVSNPFPSFLGSALTDIFYYRNRLGLASGDVAFLSRMGDPFNLFIETATAVLDTDPIDYAITSNKVANIRFAVPFNRSLLLFTDQQQFQITGGEVLTPKTIRADPVTEFPSSARCRPTLSGNTVFFAADRDNSTAIREYYVEADTVSNDAADVTAHVPTYIPAGAYKLSACATEDALVVLSGTDLTKVWLYKYFWGKEEKVQSSWSRLTFDAGDSVLDAEFIGSTLYFVIERSDGVYLEKMSLEAFRADTGLTFLVHLDRRTSLTGSYDAVNDRTTWTLPYADNGTFAVILGPSFGSSAGIALNTTRPSSTTIRASGNWSAGACFVGRVYTMRMRFSTIYLRDEKNVARLEAVMKIKRMLVSYNASGYFRAEVTPLGRSTYTYEFNGRYVGSLVVGQVMLLNGEFRFPVNTSNHSATIDLVSDSHLPCAFQSAEWVAEVTTKAAAQ